MENVTPGKTQGPGNRGDRKVPKKGRSTKWTKLIKERTFRMNKDTRWRLMGPTLERNNVNSIYQLPLDVQEELAKRINNVTLPEGEKKWM